MSRIPDSHSSFKYHPINASLNLVQRRNERHLTPTKQRVPATKHKYFEAASKSVVDPHTTSVENVSLNAKCSGQNNRNGVMRR